MRKTDITVTSNIILQLCDLKQNNLYLNDFWYNIYLHFKKVNID